MDRDTLFVETLRDLERRTAGGATEYEVLRSAFLIRQLLIEDGALAHQVNRERRIRFRYLVNVRPPIWERVGGPMPKFWTRQDGFDPASGFPGEPTELSFDAFLHQLSMVVDGHRFTVKDVIDQAAYVVGAVHAGSPRDPGEEAVAAFTDGLTIGGLNPLVRSLEGIGRVIVRGLAPLRKAIEEDPQA